MTHKTCTKCGTSKQLDDFPLKRAMKDGRDSRCKLCKNKDRARYARAKNYKEHAKAYYSRNTHKWAAIKAKRRMAEKNAVPKWVTAEEFDRMQKYYELAKVLSTSAGVRFEVDHIIPLQGREVCGLHCATNLRVILRSVNRSKGNTFEEL